MLRRGGHSRRQKQQRSAGLKRGQQPGAFAGTLPNRIFTLANVPDSCVRGYPARRFQPVVISDRSWPDGHHRSSVSELHPARDFLPPARYLPVA